MNNELLVCSVIGGWLFSWYLIVFCRMWVIFLLGWICVGVNVCLLKFMCICRVLWFGMFRLWWMKFVWCSFVVCVNVLCVFRVLVSMSKVVVNWVGCMRALVIKDGWWGGVLFVLFLVLGVFDVFGWFYDVVDLYCFVVMGIDGWGFVCVCIW